MKLVLWRHPRAEGASGRCIGRTDLRVDPRRAKRLAHRVRSAARREGWPAVIHTSDLQRSAAVGRWLRCWGWTHRIDPRLSELDFGRWDGRAWQDIPHEEVAAWEADFARHAPGGAESLEGLLARVRSFIADCAVAPTVLAITHGGVMQALAWQATQPWQAAPPHGTRVEVNVPLGQAAPAARGGAL